MRLLRRKVGVKIILGYLIVIALMTVISELALSRLDEISATMLNLTDRLAGDWTLSNEVANRIILARLYANQYVSSHQQTALDQFRAEMTALQDLLARFEAPGIDPAHRDRFAAIHADVTAYDAAFEQAAALIMDQDEVQSQVLDVKGLVIDNQLAALRIGLNALNDPAVFLSLGNAQNAFQLMRLNAAKYLTDGDERYAVLFDRVYQQTQTAFNDLAAVVRDPAQSQNLAAAKTATADYNGGLQRLRSSYAALRRLFTQELDVIEPRISTMAANVVTELAQQLQADNARSQNLVVETRTILLVTTALAVLVSLGLGLLVSRDITRPLQQVMRTSQQVSDVDVYALTTQLERLSTGDVRLQLDITATPLAVLRIDEVGNMARAFNAIIFQLQAAQHAFDHTAAYLNEMARTATSVARGDLNVTIAPRSSADVLGNALQDMLTNLRAAEQKMQRQFERLTALRDIDAMITAGRGLSVSLNFLLDKALRYLDLEAAEIWLVVSAAQPPERFAHHGRELGDLASFAQQVAREQRSLVIDPLLATELLPPDQPAPPMAFYSRPLIVQDEIKGVLQVFHTVSFAPTSEWWGFLEALSSQAAIAIDNDQLVRGLEERVALRTAELEAQKEALRQSEQRLSLHVHQTNLAVIEWNVGFKVVAWNPGAEVIFGYARAEALGRHATDLIVPAHAQEQSASVWDNLLRCQESIHIVNENRRSDGQLIVCDWNHTPLIDQEGNVIGVTSLAQDITDRIRAEEELRRAKDAAEAANRAKSAFLANMSHELRTPLNAIIGFSDLMLRDTSLGSEQRQNMAIVHHSGEHLLGLINSVLDMAKIEAGHMVLREQPFDLHALLETVVEMFGLRAADKGLALRLMIDPRVPQFVAADESKLRQVLINLVSNAIKFTATGQVILRAQRAQRMAPGSVDAEAGADLSPHVAFEVSDTGPGIAPADLEKIFEPFVQAHDLTEGQEGTGLGLPISREFVRLMGGELTATSALGEGTSFNFDLPLLISSREPAYADAAPYRQAIGLEPGQPAYRVLVVEDREYSRRLLEKLLSQLGLEVRSAVNGAEGVALWQTWQPHVVFMDMRMPIMDGHEATRRIRAMSHGQATVIIALTASAFEEDRVLMLAEGCNDFVRKPFRPADITETLRKHAGIRFAYADQPVLPLGTGVTFDEVRLDFTGVPRDWLAALRTAAVQADGDRLAILLDEVRPAHPTLAAAVMQLAENFDYDAILLALDQAAAPRVE